MQKCKGFGTPLMLHPTVEIFASLKVIFLQVQGIVRVQALEENTNTK
jgi:hypothetical protein